MKLKGLAFLSVLLAAALAQAGVLYWQIDTASAPADYAWARVVYGENGTVSGSALSYVITPGGSADSEYVSLEAADGATIGTDITSITDYSSKMFWVELYSSEGTWLAQSDNYTGVSGATLANYVHEPSSFLPSELTQGAYMFGNFVSLPEPTSGVLLLIGAGLLGLRRRKQV